MQQQNRQDAVKKLAETSSLVLVVGSVNSSNSTRLKELAERMGATAHLIDNASEIQQEWLKDIQRVGVTAGASAPEVLVREVIDRLIEEGGSEPEEILGQEENVSFSIPKELRIIELTK